MTPERLSSDENKESGESASVSEPQHSISGFKGITPGEKAAKDVFMDGGSSSGDLPPLPNPSPLLFYPSYPSPAFTYGMCKRKL
ncbi:hypothetical protein E2C01_079742 [Portunus trituberculatus]|uniref:Uncharacterized protein n=1 Tax=Portunus trituberculatus TaxID=210409 RepID=A0A5B7IRA8_PORTR|nr:hypothetical protein [Portunus trituberculatus]